MDKMTHTRFNLNNFLLSVSQAIDNTVKANKFKTPHSSQRIGYIALNIGIFNNFSELELADILTFALLEKLGIKSEDIDFFPFSNKLIFENQLFSQLMILANEVEKNLNIKDGYIINQDHVVESIEYLNINEVLKENFFFLCEKESFWLDLTNEIRLPFLMLDMICDTTLEVSYSNLIGIAKVIYDISNKYANKNYEHTIDKNIVKMCKFYGFDEKDSSRMILSGYFHNIGYLKIPQNILLKEFKFTKEDEQAIKSIPYHTKQILSMIFGFEDIVKLASSVYEKIDGNGYPYKLSGSDLGLKNRILSLAVAIQDFSEDKYQNKLFAKKDIHDELKNMVKIGWLDASIVKDFMSIG